MKSRPVAVLLTLIVLLGASASFGADAQFPFGSHIGLVPPPGMVRSDNFPGFEDRERQAAILISQLPGPAYEQFLKAMNSGAIEIPGVSNAKARIMLIDGGGAGHLVVGDQEAEGIKFRKWLMITRRSVTRKNTELTFASLSRRKCRSTRTDAYPDAVIRKALRPRPCAPRSRRRKSSTTCRSRSTNFADFTGVRSSSRAAQ